MNLTRHLLAFTALMVAAALESSRAETLSIDAGDFTTPSSATFSASGNGGIYQAFDTGSGSGTYTALFRIQANSTERGYNYDYANGGTAPFDQKSGVGTLDLDLGSVPLVTIGGSQYLQFLVDVNENDSLVTLTEWRIYIDTDNAVGNTDDIRVTTEAGLGALGTVVYDLDYDYVNNVAVDNTLNVTPKAGSGTSDISINMPLERFLGYQSTDNVYVWMKWTNTESGFEEAAIFVGATANFSSLPEPGTGLGAAAMLALAGSMRPRRASTRSRTA